MRKRTIALAGALMLAGGAVVSAAGMWGTYRGNDVVRLTVDGEPLDAGDVPAILYQGRTMIPVYLLGQVGVAYTWDQKTQTVHMEERDRTYAAAAFVAEGYAEAARHSRTMVEQLKNGLLQKQLEGRAPAPADHAAELRRLLDLANEQLVAHSAVLDDAVYESFLTYNATAESVLAAVRDAQQRVGEAISRSADDPEFADKIASAGEATVRATSRAAELETKARAIYLAQMNEILR